MPDTQSGEHAVYDAINISPNNRCGTRFCENNHQKTHIKSHWYSPSPTFPHFPHSRASSFLIEGLARCVAVVYLLFTTYFIIHLDEKSLEQTTFKCLYIKTIKLNRMRIYFVLLFEQAPWLKSDVVVGWNGFM